MIETTHRLCYGQVSVYFPILHKDMITKDFERALILKRCNGKIYERYYRYRFLCIL
ncbi:hypothetical protein OGZ02_16285 [Brachyspira hyodysenteriae]|nr:hypothetical protein [Brachyspira hyodysenteriae]MDA1470327.1 hypothetical protein [Brachyspira hyodysenteriae]